MGVGQVVSGAKHFVSTLTLLATVDLKEMPSGPESHDHKAARAVGSGGQQRAVS